jgi:hypothetical protein
MPIHVTQARASPAAAGGDAVEGLKLYLTEDVRFRLRMLAFQRVKKLSTVANEVLDGTYRAGRWSGRSRMDHMDDDEGLIYRTAYSDARRIIERLEWASTQRGAGEPWDAMDHLDAVLAEVAKKTKRSPETPEVREGVEDALSGRTPRW